MFVTSFPDNSFQKFDIVSHSCLATVAFQHGVLEGIILLLRRLVAKNCLNTVEAFLMGLPVLETRKKGSLFLHTAESDFFF